MQSPWYGDKCGRLTMNIEDLEVDELDFVQHTCDETMTRVILVEAEQVGNLTSTKMLIVEPLSLDITFAPKKEDPDA
jgi:hypothetical protein